MFWTFNLSFDILATVWPTFPNTVRIFVQFSGHSEALQLSWPVRSRQRKTFYNIDNKSQCCKKNLFVIGVQGKYARMFVP